MEQGSHPYPVSPPVVLECQDRSHPAHRPRTRRERAAARAIPRAAWGVPNTNRMTGPNVFVAGARHGGPTDVDDHPRHRSPMSRDTTTVEVIGLVVNLDAAVSGSPTCLAEP